MYLLRDIYYICYLFNFKFVNKENIHLHLNNHKCKMYIKMLILSVLDCPGVHCSISLKEHKYQNDIAAM